MAAPKKKAIPVTKASAKSTGKAKAIPINKKALDAKQAKLTAMDKASYQKGLSAGLKASKMPGMSAKSSAQFDQARGYSAGVISGKQDIAKFKRNQAKKK